MMHVMALVLILATSHTAYGLKHCTCLGSRYEDLVEEKEKEKQKQEAAQNKNQKPPHEDKKSHEPAKKENSATPRSENIIHQRAHEVTVHHHVHEQQQVASSDTMPHETIIPAQLTEQVTEEQRGTTFVPVHHLPAHNDEDTKAGAVSAGSGQYGVVNNAFNNSLSVQSGVAHDSFNNSVPTSATTVDYQFQQQLHPSSPTVVASAVVSHGASVSSQKQPNIREISQGHVPQETTQQHSSSSVQLVQDIVRQQEPIVGASIQRAAEQRDQHTAEQRGQQFGVAHAHLAASNQKNSLHDSKASVVQPTNAVSSSNVVSPATTSQNPVKGESLEQNNKDVVSGEVADDAAVAKENVAQRAMKKIKRNVAQIIDRKKTVAAFATVGVLARLGVERWWQSLRGSPSIVQPASLPTTMPDVEVSPADAPAPAADVPGAEPGVASADVPATNPENVPWKEKDPKDWGMDDLAAVLEDNEKEAAKQLAAKPQVAKKTITRYSGEDLGDEQAGSSSAPSASVVDDGRLAQLENERQQHLALIQEHERTRDQLEARLSEARKKIGASAKDSEAAHIAQAELSDLQSRQTALEGVEDRLREKEKELARQHADRTAEIERLEAERQAERDEAERQRLALAQEKKRLEDEKKAKEEALKQREMSNANLKEYLVRAEERLKEQEKQQRLAQSALEREQALRESAERDARARAQSTLLTREQLEAANERAATAQAQVELALEATLAQDAREKALEEELRRLRGESSTGQE